MIKFQLNGSARSLAIELDELAKKLEIKEMSYTKQAYSKARMKIKHEVYIGMNNALIEEYYKGAQKEIKGYRILGVDGSGVELPYGEEIQKEFGNVNKQEGQINYSWSSVIYDLLNEVTIDSALNKSGTPEREAAIEQLRRIKEEGKQRKDIIVADRGYPSKELFAELIVMGYDFIIRYSERSFIGEAKEFRESKEKETIINISVKEGQRRLGKKQIWEELEKKGIEKISLRLVKFRLSTGQMEYIVTSLLDAKEITISDIKKLYNKRWKEEGYFKYIKYTLECENFSGKLPETIRQDYYSRMLIGNVHRLMLKEAQEITNKEVKKNKELKYKEYKVNKNVTYGLFRNQIFKLLEEQNTTWEIEYDELVKKMSKYIIAVIPDRSFPRKRNGSLKHPINYRRAI